MLQHCCTHYTNPFRRSQFHFSLPPSLSFTCNLQPWFLFSDYYSVESIIIMSDLAQDSSRHCAVSIIKLNSCWNSYLVSGSFCILVVYFCVYIFEKNRSTTIVHFELHLVYLLFYHFVHFIFNVRFRQLYKRTWRTWNVGDATEIN